MSGEKVLEIQEPRPVTLPVRSLVFSHKPGRGPELRALTDCLAKDLGVLARTRFTESSSAVELSPVNATCSNCEKGATLLVDGEGVTRAIASQAIGGVARWDECPYGVLACKSVTDCLQGPVQVAGVEVQPEP